MTDAAEATVEDLSTDGRGVARIEGRACFIAGTFPGDRVRVEIEPRAKLLSGTLVELLKPSPHRVEHPCPHAHKCPASPWGWLAYEQQLEAKQRLVARTLRKAIGEIEVLPTVPSLRPWHYRNRLSLRLSFEGRTPAVGYLRGPRSGETASVRTCKLGSEAVDDLVQSLADQLSRVAVDEFDVRPHRVQIHETLAGVGAMLIAPEWKPGQYEPWAELLNQAGATGGVWFARGSRAGALRPGQSFVRTPEARLMRGEWLSFRFEVHPASFMQVNYAAADRVLERLQQYARRESYAEVWDIYGGYGALGYALAGEEHTLRVVEISPFAETAFHKLESFVHATNGQFLRGDALSIFPRHSTHLAADDIVVLDPPRSGVHEQIVKSLGNSACGRVVYLSCDPASLARDLRMLKDYGFSPVEIQPYDFFPQTPAIETLAILER